MQALVSKRIALYLLFFVVSQILYQVGISTMQQPAFDENHYVPAARIFLEKRINAIPEHPPLGIVLIATSILIGGDSPFGWRLGSAVSASLLLLGILALCFACGMRRKRVAYVGMLALSSHFIFIQARIAMLDIYLCAMIMWALVLFVRALFNTHPHHKKILLGGSALLWGAATCVKWIGLPGFAACSLYLLLLKVVQSFSFSSTRNPHSWHNPSYLHNINIWMAFGIFLLSFVIGYTLPYLLLADTQIIASIHETWALQQAVPEDHPYRSSVWQWPLLLRPIWYEYLEHGVNNVQAIFYLGNPFLLLLGLGTICWSVRNWLRHGSMLSFINVVFYCTFFFFWAFVARKASYHYYYFLPALFLIMASGECFANYLDARTRIAAWLVLGISALLFIFYYPVISGWSLPILGYLEFWIWFDKWT